MRIKIIRIITIGLFLLITAWLFYIQAIKGNYYYKLSINNRIRVVPLEGWRGRILDRNGYVLADNQISYDVMISPQEVADENALFGFLSDVLTLDPREIARRYQQKKWAPFAPIILVENIGREKAIILEENKYLYPSLIVQENFRRSYPLKSSSAHVLGYVGKINRAKKEKFKEYGYSYQSIIGYTGVEEYYDSYLKGTEGGLQIEVDNRGQQVRLLSLKEPRKGQDITLTIDKTIQEISSSLLEGKRGAIILMDLKSGEILGLTSSPSYDPNIFTQREKRHLTAKLFADPSSPLLNRAIKGLYPPGSVFKVLIALSSLDIKKTSQHTQFICNGFIIKGGKKFRCTHSHGSQNLIEAIAHSCNVYFYNLGLIVGLDNISHHAKLLGLGQLTDIDLPGEEVGHIPTRRQGLLSYRRQWHQGDTLNLSIGQGDVLTTPIQIVRVMATIVNEGTEVQPHVIKAIGGQEVSFLFYDHNVDIDKDIFQIVKKGLRATVSDYSGTAHVLDLKGLYVSGKTGTAQSSGMKKPHAWFAGYAQGEKRHIVFCVLLEHGGSSQNANLLARKLLLQLQEKKLL